MDGRDELSIYLDAEGRVKEWPGKKKERAKRLILEYLASKFESGIVYSEGQVNDLLRQYHTFDDWALLRRELFEQGFLNREKDGSSYWLTAHTTFL